MFHPISRNGRERNSRILTGEAVVSRAPKTWTPGQAARSWRGLAMAPAASAVAANVNFILRGKYLQLAGRNVQVLTSTETTRGKTV